MPRGWYNVKFKPTRTLKHRKKTYKTGKIYTVRRKLGKPDIRSLRNKTHQQLVGHKILGIKKLAKKRR